MKRFVTVLVILSAFSSVPAWSADEAIGWRRYFPLGAGSSWTYALTHFRSGEKRRFTATVKGQERVAAIRQDMVIVDEDQLGEHLPIGYFEDGEGFLNRSVQLEYAGGGVVSPSTTRTGQRILPPDPGALTRWENSEILLGVRYLWRYALSRGIDVDVPAGRFRDCIVVEASGLPLNEGVRTAVRPLGRYSFKDWYAPGVGLVRSESHNDRVPDGPELAFELVEYHVR